MTRVWSGRMLVAALALCLAPLALAEEGGEDGAGGAPAREAPALVAVGFQDRQDDRDCDPVEARFGRCIEEVTFVDDHAAWTAAPSDPLTRARWRTTATLYAQTWEDLAHRWFKAGDPLELTLRADGFRGLPPAPLQWEATTREDRLVHSVPGPELWLGGDRWKGTGASPLLRQVRYAAPPGQDARPPTVLLGGRFALRLGLGLEGVLHDYDLMNGDPRSSGPFFEQMYPYSQALEAADEALYPLAPFRDTAGAGSGVRFDGGLPAARDLASGQFQSFSMLLGTQIAQFGMEDYTVNHMRLLTALTAMQSPPGSLELRTGRTRDLVAAALGETDPEDEVAERVGGGMLALQQDIEINYFQLPLPLVEEYLRQIQRWYQPPPEFWDEFNDAIAFDLEDLLRQDAPPIASLDEADLRTWIEVASRPGTSEEMVEEQLERTALYLLIDGQEKARRDELQTAILLEHVNLEVISLFDATPGVRLPPGELVEGTASKWEAVLGKHGYWPAPFDQGLGAVDPTAICTTADGVAALSEPSVGAVQLDVLFVGEDGARVDEQLLWDARDQIPFLMVDDPTVTVPTLERLVGLPGERAIYRARWHVWNGWHLFWTADQRPTGDDGERLLLRTGAVCADTALAPPELVPTLTRAALLSGDFRPTTPVMEADEKRYLEGLTNDDVVGATAAGIDSAEDAKAQAEAAAELAGEVPDAIPGMAEVSADSLGGVFGGAELVLVEEVDDTTRYVRDLMRAPLKDLARRRGALLLVVFDSTSSAAELPLRDRQPRTPYARTQTRLERADASGDRFLRTATWTHYVRTGEEAGFVLVSPAYRPTESVNAKTRMPRWGRRTTVDFTLALGAGYVPVRHSRTRCTGDDYEADALAGSLCPQRGDTAYSTQGLAFDVAMLVTTWVVDDRRLALDFGPAVQFEINPGGVYPYQAWEEDAQGELQPQDDPTIYAWTVRPQFGIVGGLRGAGDPSPLWMRARKATPWGAEGADGRSRLDRVQGHVRFGFLMGPGFNGLDATALVEAWFGGSIRRARAPHASFTPYHPAFLLGPFARFQGNFVLAPGEEVRVRTLQTGVALTVGVRGQIRLKQRADSLPEAP